VDNSLVLGMNKPIAVSVLVIDDFDAIRMANKIICKRLFKEYGELNIQEAANIKEALALLSQHIFHVVLLDRDLGKDPITGDQVDGLDYIEEILALQPSTQILVLTGIRDDIAAHKARDLGAYAYLLKEGDAEYSAFREDQIKAALGRALNATIRERLERQSQSEVSEWVCRSPVMQRLEYQLQGLAVVSRPLLIQGATGLGKTEAAKKLSKYRAQLLKQKDRPFFNLNMASITGDLITSELFGHEAKSYTGAGDELKRGFFELANDGDIFLDEIGEATPNLQKALLKVIDERVFYRMGGTIELKTNAQIIFATHRDLKQMVKDGTFREDLYNRLCTFVIEMPPLEERKEDRPELVRVLLSKACGENKFRQIPVSEFPKDLMDYLCRDHVIGNIRGIENDVHRVLIGCRNQKTGEFDFNQWREALQIKKSYRPSTRSVSEIITFEQFMNLPTDILGPNCPGLKALKEKFVEKLLQEAEKKYPNIKERAEILKMPISNVYRTYSLISHVAKNRTKKSEGRLHG
jgi:DNA-binding NtrC family response regulator